MKALGIPNSKQFFEVTTIADAMALWKNLQERDKGERRAAAAANTGLSMAEAHQLAPANSSLVCALMSSHANCCPPAAPVGSHKCPVKV